MLLRLCKTLLLLGVLIFPAQSFADSGINQRIRELAESLPEVRRTFGPDSGEVLDGLRGLARLYSGLGRYDLARKHLLEAIRVSDSSRGKEHVESLALQASLAEVLIDQGRYREADVMLRSVLARQERLFLKEPGIHVPGTLPTLALIARICVDRGDYGQADAIIQKIVSLRQLLMATRSSADLARADLMIAKIYRDLGQYDRAKEVFARINLDRQRGRRVYELDAIQAVLGLALEHQRSGQFAVARSHLVETLASSERLYGSDHPYTLTVSTGLADLYLSMGELQMAETIALQALNVARKALGPSNPVALAAAAKMADIRQRQNRYPEAQEYYLRSLAGALKVYGPKSLQVAMLYRGLGDLAIQANGDRAKASWFYKQSVNNLQTARTSIQTLPIESQRSFIKRWEECYLTLQRLLIEQGRFAEAEQVGRMLKETEYFAFVRGETTSAGKRALDLTKSETEWQTQFTSWLDRPTRIAIERDALLAKRQAGKTLSGLEVRQLAELEMAQDKAYSTFRDTVNTWLNDVRAIKDEKLQEEARALELAASERLQSIVTAIGSDVALVQIVAFDDAVHVFLITPKAFKHVRSPVGRVQLFKAIFEARAALTAPEKDDSVLESRNRQQLLHARFGALYDHLIKPIEADLKDAGTNTVMLNLQGALRYLPFAALWDGRGWLIEKYQLALFTPAAQTNFSPPAPMRNGRGYGLSAAVDGLSALPGVRDELESILGSKGIPGVLTGDFAMDGDFTRASLESGLIKAPPVLHIASHFLMRPGDEGASYLVLGDGTRLTLRDISRSARLRFRGVELLTLSACETALGGDGTGLEVEGLGALAQNKGAGAVLATLWSIFDSSTSVFMKEFYFQIAQKSDSKAAALRNAQMKLIKSKAFSDPWFWAPFILMGNWK